MNTSTQDDDLMRDIGEGRMAAFEKLFFAHKERVFGYLCRLLSDRQKAEDLSQEVWMKVIRYAKHYEPRGQFTAWLMTLTRNAAINFSRSHSLTNSREESDSDAILTAQDESSLSQSDRWMESQQNMVAIKNCLEALPLRQRQTFSVWLNEDLTYDQLAVEFSLGVGSIKSLLFRARQNLEKCLGIKT